MCSVVTVIIVFFVFDVNKYYLTWLTYCNFSLICGLVQALFPKLWVLRGLKMVPYFSVQHSGIVCDLPKCHATRVASAAAAAAAQRGWQHQQCVWLMTGKWNASHRHMRVHWVDIPNCWPATTTRSPTLDIMLPITPAFRHAILIASSPSLTTKSDCLLFCLSISFSLKELQKKVVIFE